MCAEDVERGTATCPHCGSALEVPKPTAIPVPAVVAPPGPAVTSPPPAPAVVAAVATPPVPALAAAPPLAPLVVPKSQPAVGKGARRSVLVMAASLVVVVGAVVAGVQWIRAAPVRAAQAAFDEWIGDDYCTGADWPCKLSDCEIAPERGWGDMENATIFRCNLIDSPSGFSIGMAGVVYDADRQRIDSIVHSFMTKNSSADGNHTYDAARHFVHHVLPDIPDPKSVPNPGWDDCSMTLLARRGS